LFIIIIIIITCLSVGGIDKSLYKDAVPSTPLVPFNSTRYDGMFFIRTLKPRGIVVMIAMMMMMIAMMMRRRRRRWMMIMMMMIVFMMRMMIIVMNDYL